MYSKVINADYSLPKWLHDIVHQEDGKYIRDYTETKAKWREKQEAVISARKAEIQARKDAEAAERKRKAAEKKKAQAAAKKAVAKSKAAPAKPKTTKPTKPATERKKKEENISDMWSDWAKGK